MAVTTRRRPHGLASIRLQAFGFAIGSLLFASGALTAQFDPEAVQTANVQFVVGALFFTGAAGVQAWIARQNQVAAVGPWHVRDALRNPDWLSAVVQFLGTLYFNAMTIRALVEPFVSQQQANHAIWRPDVVGSSLFLVSSIVAWHPVARERRHAHVARRSVWICQANLWGSIAFGVSAVGAFYTVNGALRNPALANWATFVGGVLFFVGAVLLLPRWTRLPARSSD